MERSLFSDSHPLDVEDLHRGVSIGGLGNHALNVLWRVIGQALDDNGPPAADPHGSLTSADHPLSDADLLFRQTGPLHSMGGL